jgi:hypothetical protein
MGHHILQFQTAAPETRGAVPANGGNPPIRTDAVYVVFTSIDDTLAAMPVAHDVANALAVPVTLIHFRTVPYLLPVDAPTGVSPVEIDGFIERLRAEDPGVRLRVCLCRDERRAIPLAMRPHSLIVVAGQRQWWPTSAQRWRRRLEAAGHFVVFVDTSRDREMLHA